MATSAPPLSEFYDVAVEREKAERWAVERFPCPLGTSAADMLLRKQEFIYGEHEADELSLARRKVVERHLLEVKSFHELIYEDDEDADISGDADQPPKRRARVPRFVVFQDFEHPTHIHWTAAIQ